MLRSNLAALVFVAGAGLALQACKTDGSPTVASDAGKTARAALNDASGATKARATIVETAEGLKVTVNASGMAPGEYAFHIHTAGKCDAPDFATAGGHWNPTMKQHGKNNPAGMHMGDMPNLTIGADGTGTLTTTVPGGKLSSGDMPLFDADGAALMIHAKPDDYKTDPAGAAGARVACGVVMPG